MSRISSNIVTISRGVLQKNSFWYLDSDQTTADTNSGFEARRILTQAQQNNGNGGGGVLLMKQLR